MNVLLRMLLISLAICFASAVLSSMFGIHLDNANFWDHHHLPFLVMISFFPRLTLLFSSVSSGGVIWWLGWLLYPRILVALLATFSYWQQNPILVLISWLIAVGGESTEKYVVQRQMVRVIRTDKAPFPKDEVIDV